MAAGVTASSSRASEPSCCRPGGSAWPSSAAAASVASSSSINSGNGAAASVARRAACTAGRSSSGRSLRTRAGMAGRLQAPAGAGRSGRGCAPARRTTLHRRPGRRSPSSSRDAGRLGPLVVEGVDREGPARPGARRRWQGRHRLRPAIRVPGVVPARQHGLRRCDHLRCGPVACVRGARRWPHRCARRTATGALGSAPFQP